MSRPTPPVEPQPFVIRRSGIQGKGGFALRAIGKGERVIEYIGERISLAEADRRYDDAGMKRHHTFLFSVTGRTVIDAAVGGNDARFINHSCDPNCEAVEDDRRIFIEAVRAIAPGDELTYDYSYTRDETQSEEDEALYACRCGSPKCRGTILEPRKKRRKLPQAHHAAARHPHGTKSTRQRRGATSPARGGRKTGTSASRKPRASTT
jgi:uncharacterized protein